MNACSTTIVAAAASFILGVSGISSAFAQPRVLIVPGGPRASAPIGSEADRGVLHISPNPYEKSANAGYYLGLVTRSRAAPMPQRIAGTCASACTIRLGIRGACVEPNAELWFLPVLTKSGLIQTGLTRAMFAAMPGSIGPWAANATNSNATYDPARNFVSIFSNEYGLNAYSGTRGPHYAVLTGAQAIAMGAPGCR